MMQSGNRISSIDILRGAVMIVMALDHTRDFFHESAMTADPLNPVSTTAFLFFTRWITHFCAPAFLLLSGMSAYLSSLNRSRAEAANFLIKRGIWLIFVEIVIVTFGLTFNPFFNIIILQVIWATGCSMIFLGLVGRVSRKGVFIIGVLLVCGHNLLNYVDLPATGPGAVAWKVLITSPGFILPVSGGHILGVFYSILPWTGVMFCGYAAGQLFTDGFGAAKRKKIFIMTGSLLIILFIVLRLVNHYGNPQPFQVYADLTKSIMSFLNTSKYPPSLQYLCMTLGPALILLAVTENTRTRLSRIISVYGKVPFFYYLVHFYLIHTVLVILFFLSGYGKADIPGMPFYFRPANFGYSLPVIYCLWVTIVAALYQPCRWYLNYKSTHTGWWLRYL